MLSPAPAWPARSNIGDDMPAPRFTRRKALATLAAGIPLPAAAQAPATDFTFALIGDLGYPASEEPPLARLLADIDRDEALRFTVHVGDLASAKRAATDELLARRLGSSKPPRIPSFTLRATTNGPTATRPPSRMATRWRGSPRYGRYSSRVRIPSAGARSLWSGKAVTPPSLLIARMRAGT